MLRVSSKPILQQSLADTLIIAEVKLPQGESEVLAKVLRRSVDEDGKVIGCYNENPILNTIVYDLEFSPMVLLKSMLVM